jgi:hypothetical protein
MIRGCLICFNYRVVSISHWEKSWKFPRLMVEKRTDGSPFNAKNAGTLGLLNYSTHENILVGPDEHRSVDF